MKTRNTDELIMTIHKNQTFVVDRSYFLEIPDLIESAWILIDENKSPTGE